MTLNQKKLILAIVLTILNIVASQLLAQPIGQPVDTSINLMVLTVIPLLVLGVIIISMAAVKALPGKINCTHPEKTDVTVESTVTCEHIWTICDTCEQVLNKRVEC